MKEEESGSFDPCHGLAHRTFDQTTRDLTAEFSRDQVNSRAYGRHQVLESSF